MKKETEYLVISIQEYLELKSTAKYFIYLSTHICVYSMEMCLKKSIFFTVILSLFLDTGKKAPTVYRLLGGGL